MSNVTNILDRVDDSDELRAYYEEEFSLPVERRRKIPLILKLWTLLGCLYLMTFQTPLLFFVGLRFVHTHYYFELLLLPSVLILLFSGLRRVPKVLILLGVWVLIMGFVGYFKGNFPSFIYDRTRNWAVLLFLALLYHYDIKRDELLRMLKPLFLSAWIGNIAVILAFSFLGRRGQPRNVVSFNFMGGLYCILLFTVRPWFWYLVGPIIPFAYVFYAQTRGAMIAMASAFVVLVVSYTRRLKPAVTLAIIGFFIAGLLVYKFAPVGYAFRSKDIRAGGLEAQRIMPTLLIRIHELSILKENLHGSLNWIFGLGAGEEWSGVGFYTSETGLFRHTFHVYYAQIIYNYGLLGLILLLLVLVLPTLRGLLFFFRYDLLGQACILFMVALLVSWLNSASDLWVEVLVYSCAVYGMRVGRVETVSQSAYDYFLDEQLLADSENTY